MKSLYDVRAGNFLLVVDDDWISHLVEVKRVTPTLLHTDDWTFYKKDGKSKPHAAYPFSRVRVPTEEEYYLYAPALYDWIPQHVVLWDKWPDTLSAEEVTYSLLGSEVLVSITDKIGCTRYSVQIGCLEEAQSEDEIAKHVLSNIREVKSAAWARRERNHEKLRKAFDFIHADPKLLKALRERRGPVGL